MNRAAALRSAVCVTVVLATLAMPQVSAAQADLYGQWTTLPYLMPINPIHAVLMRNGKVLIIAGSGNVAANLPAHNLTAAVWNPISGAIAQQNLEWDMFCNGMVVLADGRPFINGGTQQYDPFHGEPRNAVFDPATNTFTNVESMAHGRWYPTPTVLGDGRVMTFSGLLEGGGTNTTVEIYTPGTGWSPEMPAGWTPPLYPRMHLLPSGRVFYSGPNSVSRLFNPATGNWPIVTTTKYGSSRAYGSSVLLPLRPEDNYAPKVLIMGGGNPSTASTELIDLSAATPTWNFGPSMSQPRIEMNGVLLPDGKVLALGGSLNDEDVATASLNADLYDPATNTMSSAGSNAFPRLYHSVALLLPDATVWFAGGNPRRGTYEQQMEIYKPAYLFTRDGSGSVIAATRPAITSAPATISYGNTFTVQTPDAASISQAVLIRPGSPTHAFDQEQRLVGMTFTTGSGVLNVTAPPNGNIAPPGYYMLFLLNSSGVPSVASFVKLTQASATPDFTVGITPSSQNVTRGSSANYTVSVIGSDGFSGAVGFSVTGLPSGATATFTPSTVTGSGTSVMNVATLASTAVGTYPLTITATSGSLVHTTSATLVVSAATDFSISVSPSSQNVTRGSSANYTVSVTASGGFSGVVGFSVTGLPSGATATFTPSTVTGSGTSVMSVATLSSTALGTYPLTITATSGSLVHTTSATLVVSAPTDFSISVSPSSSTVQKNKSTQYQVTISALNGFTGSVQLSVSGLPARTSASFNLNPVNGSGVSTLNIKALPKSQSGTYNFTIRGTSGSLVHSTSATLIIQ